MKTTNRLAHAACLLLPMAIVLLLVNSQHYSLEILVLLGTVLISAVETFCHGKRAARLRQQIATARAAIVSVSFITY